MHVVKNVNRVFAPNVQSVRTKVNGSTKRQNVCTACIRSGKIEKA